MESQGFMSIIVGGGGLLDEKYCPASKNRIANTAIALDFSANLLQNRNAFRGLESLQSPNREVCCA